LKDEERKSVKVNKDIKNILQSLKVKLNLSNESEIIAYLYAIYENHYPRITLPEHEKAMKRVEDIHNQLSI
jgi:flagellin-specific chaperone FliS